MNKLFYKKVLVEPKKKDRAKINFKKIIVTIIILLLAGLFTLKVVSFVNQVSSRWDQIVFAYNKPAIVSAIKKDYDIKQAKLEQSFLIKDKSAEDKLIEEVVSKLKDQQSK
uniref:Uncharacterized protein n=1 Tax=viral metagenome TaxID=1070528 RepID=A0A6M3IFT6_9ZZZZ